MSHGFESKGVACGKWRALNRSIPSGHAWKIAMLLPTFFSPALFEVPRGYVEPIVQYLRLANTTLDFLFYDVNAFRADLSKLGWDVEVDESPLDPSGLTRLLKRLDLSALSNLEGAILVVDATRRPYVKAFRNVAKFLHDDATKKIGAISITGVGSSALG
jgi:hypothetical protein